MTSASDRSTEARVNILLVDDQPANLLVLEAILADLDQNLVRASSGAEALRYLLQQDFAAILLDVQMHGLDGFETARLIRGRGRSRHTPIIFLTAYDSPDFSAEQAYGLGAVDYLVKPLVPVILRAKVAVFVELARQAEALRRLERREAERRLAEESLRQSEAHFRLMADSAPVLLFVSDTEGRSTFFNRPWLEFTGRTLEQELGDGWATGVHPEERERCLDAYRSAIAARRPFRTEYRLRRADGASRWVLATGVPRFDTGGDFAGFIGSAIDITDRRDAEEQVRRSQRELADFIENATVGLHWAGPDGIILWANRAELALLGYTREEYVGRHIAEFHADPAVIADILQRLANNEVLHNYVARLRCKDGSLRDVLINSNVLWEDGKFVHTRCFTRDVTAARESERERARLLAREQEANRRKDEFLAMLAHELRNPLAPLLPSLEVLRQARADAAVRAQTVDRMERQIRHLNRLVEDLLDASLIVHGKVGLRPERLDLARLARTTAEDRRALLEQAGLTLKVETPETPLWVTGDATRLAQALNNLLDNAAKFSDAGGIVTVQAMADAAHGQVVLTVADAGQGIEAEVLPRLFQPFAQADDSLDRSRGGLGLGLVVLKRLVDLHGGEVEAASAGRGLGASFTVRLPAEQEPPALAATPATPSPAGARLRILVVEDNKDAADSLRLLLELLGHETRVAYTGPEGVRAAYAWQPDIVLCDIGLPGLDGYGVARELRLNPATARVRLLALTGYGSDEDRRRSQEAGFDLHLTKPIAPETLQDVLVRQGA